MFLIQNKKNSLEWKKFDERFVHRSSDGSLHLYPEQYTDALERLYALEEADAAGTLFDTKIGFSADYKLYSLSSGDSDSVGSLLITPSGLDILGEKFTELTLKIINRADNKQTFNPFRILNGDRNDQR